MVSYESGPWHIFEKFRERIGIKHDGNTGLPIQWPDKLIANLITCVWCLSIWIGAFLVLIYQADPAVTRVVVAPFVDSAGAILFERLVR